MVLLGLAFALMKRFPKGADRGLYAGKGIMHGVKVTFSNKKWVEHSVQVVQKSSHVARGTCDGCMVHSTDIECVEGLAGVAEQLKAGSTSSVWSNFMIGTARGWGLSLRAHSKQIAPNSRD